MLETIFNKEAASAALLKRDSNIRLSCDYCEIFKNVCFLHVLKYAEFFHFTSVQSHEIIFDR